MQRIVQSFGNLTLARILTTNGSLERPHPRMHCAQPRALVPSAQLCAPLGQLSLFGQVAELCCPQCDEFGAYCSRYPALGSAVVVLQKACCGHARHSTWPLVSGLGLGSGLGCGSRVRVWSGFGFGFAVSVGFWMRELVYAPRHRQSARCHHTHWIR